MFGKRAQRKRSHANETKTRCLQDKVRPLHMPQLLLTSGNQKRQICDLWEAANIEELRRLESYATQESIFFAASILGPSFASQTIYLQQRVLYVRTKQDA